MTFTQLKQHNPKPNERLMLYGTAHEPPELTQIVNCMARRKKCSRRGVFDYFNFDKIGREKITQNH